MRILHTSDWHLGKNLEHINRIDEQREFIDYLCRTVRDEQVDIILIAGDVFDTCNPSAAAEELFYDALDRLNDGGKRAVVAIAGNHDNPDRLCAASPLAYKNGILLIGYPGSDGCIYKTDKGDVRDIRVVDAGPGWTEIYVSRCRQSAVIITLPYPSEARLEQVLSTGIEETEMQKAYSDKVGSIFKGLSRKFRDDTINLAVSHIFLKGGRESDSERTLQVGGAMTVDPCILPPSAHFVALGHLHRPQQVKNAPCPAYYSGSPLAYSFSEADYTKALYIIDAVPGENADIRKLDIPCGIPLRRWVAKQGIEEVFEWCKQGRDSNAWIDLEVYTDRVLTVEEQKALRKLNPGIINIRPVIKCGIEKTSEYQSREGKKIDELFKEYYRYRMGIEISEELMEVFIEALNQEQDMSEGGEGA